MFHMSFFDFLAIISNKMSKSLRSGTLDLLIIPHSILKMKGDRAFSVAAPKLWNSLLLSLTNVDSVVALNGQLNIFLFLILIW